MNLIICYTPLQVLIAEKIIVQYPNEEFFGVMIYVAKNPKFEHYSERLKQSCSHFFSLHQHTDRVNLLKEILLLKWKFSGKYFDKVFVASINDIQIQFLLSSIQFKTFYTFDDGTANIVNSSIFYVEEPNTIIRKLINKGLCNKYSVKKLKAISQAHYTIYPNFPNIIENTIYVDLFQQKSGRVEKDNVVNILLGQPVYAEDKKNVDLAEKIIKKFDIDFYLPHPREQYQLTDVEYIRTPLIFEDYIAQNFAHQKCRIYTYFSSAVLNIKSDNIDVISLRIETDNPSFIACYNLLAQVNIPVIDVRE